jgi:hypothetical protein
MEKLALDYKHNLIHKNDEISELKLQLKHSVALVSTREQDNQRLRDDF